MQLHEVRGSGSISEGAPSTENDVFRSTPRGVLSILQGVCTRTVAGRGSEHVPSTEEGITQNLQLSMKHDLELKITSV